MNTVTFQGKTLHLEGNLPEIGKKAPDFSLATIELGKKTLKDYKGKVLVLASVPSLDTPVCDLEVRHFNAEAAKLSEKVQMACVSCDLPFAQERWRNAAGAMKVEPLSDYMDNNFGKSYGVLIEEWRLLARAVFVINADGILTYTQLVPEVTNPPDYAAALEAVKKAL